MGKICGIFGMSGDGKTTSTIINPDGGFSLTKEGYKGLDPKSHFIINLDMKDLPFPAGMWSTENKNYIATDDIKVIRDSLNWCAKNTEIKSVSLDTINLYLAYKEYNDRRKLSFDQYKN
jgi:hypothetical protein